MRSRVRHYYPALGGAVHIRVRASTGELCRLGDASPEIRAASVAGNRLEGELANRGLVFSVIVGATISPRAQRGRDQRDPIPPNMKMLCRAFLPCQRRHMFIVLIGITSAIGRRGCGSRLPLRLGWPSSPWSPSLPTTCTCSAGVRLTVSLRNWPNLGLAFAAQSAAGACRRPDGELGEADRLCRQGA